MNPVPFHKPSYDASDEQALTAAIRSGKLVGDGDHTRRASEEFGRLVGVPHVLLTPSCTHALELAMMTAGIGPGAEVIVPSFTFVSTTNCVLRQGARLVLADIDPRTLTISIEEIRRSISPATRAIIAVGYAGVSPAMEEIMAIAREHDILVVEDAAQSVGATYLGKAQGTTGHMGCYSFHETKNISTGEGGAFVTPHTDLATRAEIIREKGTNRRQFMLGLVDKYTWVDMGSSYLPSDLTGALLLSQLTRVSSIIRDRERIHRRYDEAFSEDAAAERLSLPCIPPHTGSNYHIYYVLMRDEFVRNAAIAFLRDRHIGTTFHYLPLHLSPMGQRYTSARKGDLPVTENVSGRLLRLPIYPSLSTEEQDYVIASMKEFLAS